jgi:hypothetical protein
MTTRLPSLGVSGPGVAMVTLGGLLVYVGLRDVPFMAASRDLLRGKTDTPRREGDTTTLSDALGKAATSRGVGTGEVESGAAGPAGPPSGRIVKAPGTNIRVDASIAQNVGALVATARAAGIRLTGGGYRSNAEQRRLRIVNGCPDVDTSPSSSCRVPTARPGQSMHERGLAIDFSAGGVLIRSRESAAFRWLADNAGRFGLKNLPGEPWHWSTNGK